MMPEISLNILDVAENSVRAGAPHIHIEVMADTAKDALTVVIDDDGSGMDEEQLAHVTDPFFTTRTTRRVGLGVPFFKLAAELSGGSFDISSTKGVGTKVTAVFGLSNVDRMPLGDIGETIHSLILMHEEISFLFLFSYDEKSFTLDTDEMHAVLGDDISFQEPEVSTYIKEFLAENIREVCDGKPL